MRNTYYEEETVWRKKFGNKLKRMIHIKEMTQGEFAEELGISEVTLSRYITGTCAPSPLRLQYMAGVLNCSVDSLLDLEN